MDKGKGISFVKLSIVVGFCTVLEIFIFTKLIELQFFGHARYQTRVTEQSERRVKVIPKRGRIYDCNYKLLALNRGKKRIYPLQELAGNLLGFVGRDGIGLAGVEYEFNHILSGSPGWLTMAKTPYGKLYPYPGLPMQPMKSANDIVLTIDADIESIVELMLTKRVMEVGAKGGSGIVMDCRTGEILAMANVPTCNPMEWRKYRRWDNGAIQMQFEPGSTFKIVPISLLVRNKLVGLTEIVEDGSGEVTIGKHTIHDVHSHDAFTFLQAVWHSSNVAFVKLSPRIGKENFYVGARLFGFGSPTGVPLPGEAYGKISSPDRWSTLTFANISFGQGVSCNLLQVACAYQAIANGGELLRPIIIKEIISPEGEKIYEAAPILVRKVLTPGDADLVTSLLCGVVENGSGMTARISGIKIAGKTGTAQKAINGKYQRAYISSFIAFFPADNPRLLVACIVDEPQKVYLGSQVCGPLVKSIIERLLCLSQYQCLIDTPSDTLENLVRSVDCRDNSNAKLLFFSKSSLGKLTQVIK